MIGHDWPRGSENAEFVLHCLAWAGIASGLVSYLMLTITSVRHESALGRWTFTVGIPRDPALASVVEMFWTIDSAGTYARERILPRTTTELIFALDGAYRVIDRATAAPLQTFTTSWVSGLHLSPMSVESPAAASLAGIRLRSRGAMRVLADTPAAYAGNVVPFEDAAGAWARTVRQRVGDSRDHAARLRVLATAAAQRFTTARHVDNVVHAAVDAISQSRGRVSIERLAATSGYSRRHLSDRFRNQIGVTPKSYARIVRLEQTLRLLRENGMNGSELAARAGFYDQAHLLHEFRAMTGATPGEAAPRLAPDGMALVGA